jgi:phenylacetate-coenzyme A ligase PaaK-like adenylate-forming protein
MAITDSDKDPRWQILDPARQPDDPEVYLRAAVAWHFSPETGSPFWLRRVRRLDFDPLTDVRSYADLAKFPNIVDELRDVPVEDLIPRGYGPNPPAPKVFETGGTTGAPKRVVLMPDWIDAAVERMLHGAQFGGRAPANILAAVPTGPHKIGVFYDFLVPRLNVVKFSIDVDPRWVKKLIAKGRDDQVKAYVEHILDQIEHLLSSQSVGTLVITPPLLQACAQRARLRELINSKVELVFWGGAHMDIEQRLELENRHFPNVKLVSRYSSALILEGAGERPGVDRAEEIIYDPRSPVVTFRVIDPATGDEVAYGERGQVVMSHISRGMFLPNNAERDSAIRVPALPGRIGDAVSAPRPLLVFGGERAIEGIY